jgi:hypothetical protein
MALPRVRSGRTCLMDISGVPLLGRFEKANQSRSWLILRPPVQRSEDYIVNTRCEKLLSHCFGLSGSEAGGLFSRRGLYALDSSILKLELSGSHSDRIVSWDGRSGHLDTCGLMGNGGKAMTFRENQQPNPVRSRFEPNAHDSPGSEAHDAQAQEPDNAEVKTGARQASG